jgi:predicted Na+-dependent transporter
MGVAAEVFSNLLLFMLVFGMAATVESEHLKKQINNRKAFCIGLFLQFVVLPFLGFLVVFTLRLEPPLGITLLVVTSSPGGSYSNWWCSLFNADLALSVAMTAVSTICSIAFLPLNLLIYSTLIYEGDGDVVKELDWGALFISLSMVILAITSGLFCSARVHSPVFNVYANRFGNFAGVALILVSTVLSSGGPNNTAGIVQVWQQGFLFYLGVASPCVLGLIAANLVTTFVFKLVNKAERV